MKAEAVLIVERMQDVFKRDPALAYFEDRVTIFEDELELMDEGKFPYMNLVIQDIKKTAASNQIIQHVERHRYPIQLFFANRNESKPAIMIGDEAELFKGLFNIYDDICKVIRKDPTFGEVVKDVPDAPEFTSAVYRYQEGQYYVGRALMMFEVYKDVIIKK